jgi:hypothetical protein
MKGMKEKHKTKRWTAPKSLLSVSHSYQPWISNARDLDKQGKDCINKLLWFVRDSRLEVKERKNRD